jgi:alkylhydroperoxidase family enzyme
LKTGFDAGQGLSARSTHNKTMNGRGRMPWIHQVPIDEATGLLKRQFEAAIERAGRVWRIVHIMSVNPPVLDHSISFYGAVMHGPSPLSRVQRELLATVVSAELDCFY